MNVRSLLVVMVLMGTALTGCLSGDEGAPAPAATEDNSTSLNTSAPDGRGTVVAFEETNATEDGVGGVDHHHDQWNGASRVVMFEREAMMQPMGSGNAAGYKATATFKPSLHTLVFEGTETVEFTISNPKRHWCEGEFTMGGEYICTDNFLGVPAVDDPTGGPSGLQLRYKHASTTQWIDVGELAWETPLPIKITDPRQTDMPHATSSLWEFQVVSPHQHDSTLTFTAKAELIRGEGDIPLWPGHPDFYPGDITSRVVLDRPDAVACDGPSGCALASGEPGPIFADKLISYGTRTLHIWVNVSDYQAPNPATAPSNWFLFNINATGEDNITNPFAEDHPITQMEHYWVLPVDDNGMDSPYADGSRWNFMLGASLTTPLVSCYGGCAEWSAKYSIKIIATDVELPAEEYDTYCLRDSNCPDEGTGEGDSLRYAATADELRALGREF